MRPDPAGAAPSPTGYVYPPDGTLNYSQLAEWMKCRYRWDLSRNRSISTRSIQRSLDLGSAVHFGMAAAMHKVGKAKKMPKLEVVQKEASIQMEQWLETSLKARGGKERLTEEETEQWDEVENYAYTIAKKALRDMNMERFRVVLFRGKPMVERGLQFPMPKDSGWEKFHFTIDLLVEDLQYGGNWILDYKVRKQFTPPEAEEVNLQFPTYQKGLEFFGIPTLGSIMYQILAKPPTVPKLNKDGSMSRAQITSTWEVYRAALVQAGLDPKQYLDMQTKLTAEFYRETREPRTEAVVGWVWHDIILPAARSMAREAHVPVRSGMFNGVMTCNGCWARRFCLAELRGDDTDFLLSTDYIDNKNPKERIILNPGDVVFDSQA